MRRYLIFSVCLLILLLAFGGCEIKSPVGTRLDIPLRIPLLKDTYYMVDLVDSVNIFAHIDEDNPDNSYMYYFMEGEIEGEDIVSSDLRISANSEGVEIEIWVIPDVDLAASIPLSSEETDDVEIVSATIARGGFDFYFQDIDPLITRIDVHFGGMLDTNNVPLVIRISRAIIDTGELRYNLYNHQFSADPDSDIILEEIDFEIDLISAQELLPGHYGDMRVCYEEDFNFSSIRGLIHNYRVDVADDTTEIPTEYPYNIENIVQVNDPRLNVYINSYIGFDAFFTGTITARNTRVVPNLIYEFRMINEEIGAARAPGEFELTELSFREEMAGLVNIAPDQLTISDAYFIISNDEGRIGFASVGNAFEGTYDTEIPFDFTFNVEETVRPEKIQRMPISENNREHIKEYAKELTLNVNYKNYFPASATIYSYLCSEDNADLIYVQENQSTPDFDRIFFENTVVSRSEEGGFGNAILTIHISEEQMPLFYKYDAIYFGMEIQFNDDTAIFRPADKIDVTINVEAVVKLEVK